MVVSDLGAYALNEGQLFLMTKPLRKIVRHDQLRETLTVGIPLPMLKAHRSSGLSLQLNGTNGHVEFTVPEYYIQGFLEAIKE